MPDNAQSESTRIAELRRRLAAEPSSRLFLDLAREYHESGQLETAAQVCFRGLKRHPSYLSARVLLGRVLFDMGRFEESCEAMEAVLASAPDNLVARRVLAEISFELGDLPGALDRFRALLAFNPADADAKSRIDELEARLSGAAAGPAPRPAENGERELDPGVLATPTLAEIYLQQGLNDRAALVYREILKGDPDNAEALARLAEIEPPQAPPDPATESRRRRIAALTSWLEVIRRVPRSHGDHV